MRRRWLFVTWSVLLVATLLAWLLGSRLEAAPRQAHIVIALSVSTIAIIKCRLVIRNFMEVRSAPRWLQRSCDSWLLLNFGMVLAYYWR